MFSKLTISVLLAASCSGQTTLRQYLSLTNAQGAAILTLNYSFGQYLSSEQQQVNAINTQLTPLVAATAPDPQAIGTLAVQLEVIRRDETSRTSTFQQQVAAQLTPVQVNTLQTLSIAAALQPLATDAACAYLVKQSASQYTAQVPTSIQRLGDFTVFNPFPYIASPLPYIPPAPTGTFCGSTTFPISVREYLNLTDAQIAALYSASAAYNNFYARQQNRLNDINQQIASLRAAGNTDPIARGLLYAEMARIGQAITDKGNQLRDTALTQLTPTQAAQVATLQQAQDLSSNNLINTAIGCGLLVPSAGSPNYGNSPGGYCPL